MCFDEEPDGDIHGECAVEIDQLAQEVAQLKGDLMVLTLRLMGEDESTFSPETAEVMDRRRPEAEDLLGLANREDERDGSE